MCGNASPRAAAGCVRTSRGGELPYVRRPDCDPGSAPHVRAPRGDRPKKMPHRSSRAKAAPPRIALPRGLPLPYVPHHKSRRAEIPPLRPPGGRGAPDCTTMSLHWASGRTAAGKGAVQRNPRIRAALRPKAPPLFENPADRVAALCVRQRQQNYGILLNSCHFAPKGRDGTITRKRAISNCTKMCNFVEFAECSRPFSGGYTLPLHSILSQSIAFPQHLLICPKNRTILRRPPLTNAARSAILQSWCDGLHKCSPG